MKPGSYSFPLLGRCRGVVRIEQASPFHCVRAEGAEVGEKTPKVASTEVSSTNLEPVYVAALTEAFATHQGGVVTRDSFLIEELSRHLREPIRTHRHLHSFRPLRKIRKFKNTVVSLVAPCQYNYYHWLLEVLPKLELFRLYGSVGKDALYYVETSKAFQSASLDRLGITSSRRIDSRDVQVIQADRLLAATIPGPSGVAHPWAVNWLRQQFLTSLPNENHVRDLPCLIVSRRGAKNRAVLNEDDLVATLSHLNPILVSLENLSFSQQINLFQRAKIIIGPHGAGLTNLAFSGPHAHVIELFGGSYRNPCYERLASLVGCRYTALVNVDERHPSTGELNMRVAPGGVAAVAAGS